MAPATETAWSRRMSRAAVNQVSVLLDKHLNRVVQVIERQTRD